MAVARKLRLAETFTPAANQPEAGGVTSNPAVSSTSGNHTSGQVYLLQIRYLTEFVADLECRLAALRPETASASMIASEVISIFRQVTLREALTLDVEEGIEQLARKLSFPPHIERLWISLASEVQAIAAGKTDPVSTGYPARQRTILEAQSLLAWYMKRASAVISLNAGLTEGNSGPIQLGQLEVSADRFQSGVRGMEIRLKARMENCSGRQLWLKVFVKHHGRYLRVRQGWGSWRDATDAQMPSSDNFIGRFAALVPLSHETDSFLVEDLSCFVPVEALELPAGLYSLEFEAGVYAGSGEKLARVSTVADVRVPPCELRRQRNSVRLLSPQSVALWKKDFVSGDRIANMQCRAMPDKSTIGALNLQARFDFEVLNREGEMITLELRVLDAEGLPVNAGSDASSPVFNRQFVSMLVNRPWHRRFGFDMQLPLVRPGDMEDGIYFAELSVAASDGRVLCGCFEPFTWKGS